ncbi:MAG: signal peptidase I [Ruminococcaceae bacterium]|nr:signal peptidase I [Oscillospiraceae bacterium]
MSETPKDQEQKEQEQLKETVDEAEALPEADGVSVIDGKKIAREFYDWVEIFVLTIAAILLVFTFLVRIAYVDGPSMNNTLHDKETLAVSNFLYTPKQGDIVVFQSPDSDIPGGIVKRVIATEGQTVDIDFSTWTVTVDGVALDEPYVNYENGLPMRHFDVTFPVTVPENCVFVMGDNRNHSTDSRDSSIGFLDTRFIFGRVLLRITPLSKFGGVD